MTVTELTGRDARTQNQVGDHLVRPRRTLALGLRADGWTDTIALSGCTLADAIRLCAPGAWHEQADGLQRRFLADPTHRTVAGTLVGGVELTLYEDGALRRVALVGCTAEQAVTFCRFLVKFDVMVSRNWLDPLDEAVR